jgi:hypothetical protein
MSVLKFVFQQSLIFLLLLNIILHCSNALFEYVCEEKMLFKSYLHVYQGRKGPRILQAGPGFHVMTQEKDIYVCINGPYVKLLLEILQLFRNEDTISLNFEILLKNNLFFLYRAYLYYAKTTELGIVYEAPQPKLYAHTCEMHNVKPHSKATKLKFELHVNHTHSANTVFVLKNS